MLFYISLLVVQKVNNALLCIVCSLVLYDIPGIWFVFINLWFLSLVHYKPKTSVNNGIAKGWWSRGSGLPQAALICGDTLVLKSHQFYIIRAVNAIDN